MALVLADVRAVLAGEPAPIGTNSWLCSCGWIQTTERNRLAGLADATSSGEQAGAARILTVGVASDSSTGGRKRSSIASMKVSVSLPGDDVAFVDDYARSHG